MEDIKVIPPKISWFAHIDITTHCHIGNCVYCSRFERHIPEDKKYFMALSQIRAALEAYKTYPKRIGIIGGEPQLHPEFEQVCNLLLEYGSRRRYGLWTSIDPNTSKWSSVIARTFKFIAFNQHNPGQQQVCKHQPLTVALKDAVENAELRAEQTSQCYFGTQWCYTATPLGGYYCEVGAFLAYLQGIKGWGLKEGWWKNDWHEQEDICQLCGGCVPQERQLLCHPKQRMSKSFLEMLIKNGCKLGDYELVETPYTIEYMKRHASENIGAYRGDRGGRRDTEKPTIHIDWSKYEKTLDG